MFSCNKLIRALQFFLGILLAAAPLAAQKKAEWLPITAEDLALNSVPGVTGVHAIALYRESNTDDMLRTRFFYTRIKILAEEGRKYANVEIPFWKSGYKIENLEARTIRPDGTILPFDGRVFEKTVLKAGGLKIQVKALTLPEVQVGSIIEYRYTVRWEPFFWLRTEWVIQDELYTRRARFSFRPSIYGGVQWMSYNMPMGRRAVAGPDRIIRLEVENVPALVTEQYMPPESEVQTRVEFFYIQAVTETPEAFWKRIGKIQFESYEKYMHRESAMLKAVNGIVAASDPPEAKLRKIYARVQLLRNLSFAPSKADKEDKRENLKINNHVEDVWERGYGTALQLNLLFAALARAAGFSADMLLLSARSHYFFKQDMPDSRQLNTDAVLVSSGGKEYYLDPGMLRCPFGILPWPSTGVQGMRLANNSGTFVRTAAPSSPQTLIERRSTLKLQADGTLAGRLTVSFTGYEALAHRVDAQDDDELARRKDLEDLCKSWLPPGATVKLEGVTGWESSEEPLHIEYSIEVPNYSSATGQRILFAPAVFQSQLKNPFQFVQRKYPVYFSYPWQEVDDVTVELPPGFRVESQPNQHVNNATFANYQTQCKVVEGKLALHRLLSVESYYFDLNYYSPLRIFYGIVRTGDGEQVVLRAAANADSK